MLGAGYEDKCVEEVYFVCCFEMSSTSVVVTCIFNQYIFANSAFLLK